MSHTVSWPTTRERNLTTRLLLQCPLIDPLTVSPVLRYLFFLFRIVVHSASASGSSANAAAASSSSLADGDAKALSLSCSISYSGDELSGDSSEFSSLKSTSSSDEHISLFWVSSTS